MAEIITEEDESKLKIRLKSQRHVRALLIIVNLLLVGYILYFIGDLIVEKVNNRDADIVSLNNLSRAKSKKKYEELMQGRQKTIGDYVLYGTYLHVSEEKFSLDTYQPMENIYLLDAHNGALIRQELGDELNKGIDLKTMVAGDYLLAQGADGQNKEVLKIVVTKERYEETIYSLPLDSKSGLRKKITIYAYPHNPAFVIKIRDVYNLGSSYYDLILQGSNDNREAIMNILNDKTSPLYGYKLKVKELENDESLSTSYKTKSLMAVSLRDYDSGEAYILNSQYLSSDFVKDEVFADGSLQYYDQDSFIRELGGYAFKSGARVKDVPSSYEVVEYLGIHDCGKMAFVINASADEDFQTCFKSVLSFMMNTDIA